MLCNRSVILEGDRPKLFWKKKMNAKKSWHLDDYDIQGLPNMVKEAKARNQPEWERACDLVIMYLNFPFFW